MNNDTFIFLSIVKQGPIESVKLTNFGVENTVDSLKVEAGKKADVPSSSLVLVHHGKILKDNSTLHDNGVKNGETIHVIKKKEKPPPTPKPTFTDAELQQLSRAIHSLGCNPNAPGWTRAMQILSEESVRNEIFEHAPGLSEDCVAMSILHEVELLAALGANVETLRRGAEAHPELIAILRLMLRLERARANSGAPTDNSPASGFAYSLEALSEDEDLDDEENEETERNAITQEQLAAALRAATEAVASPTTGSGSRGGARESFLQLLRGAAGESSRQVGAAGRDTNTQENPERSVITPEMFSDALTEAFTRAVAPSASFSRPLEESASASASASSQQLATDQDFTTQLNHMHEMGLLDDAVNIRALIISSGDVNAAINFVFSGGMTDD